MVDVNGFIMENTFVTYNLHYVEIVYFYKRNASQCITAYVCSRAKKWLFLRNFSAHVQQAYELLLKGLFIFCRGSDSWFKGWFG
jgi:hypothetical protein